MCGTPSPALAATSTATAIHLRDGRPYGKAGYAFRPSSKAFILHGNSLPHDLCVSVSRITGYLWSKRRIQPVWDCNIDLASLLALASNVEKANTARLGLQLLCPNFNHTAVLCRKGEYSPFGIATKACDMAMEA